MSTSKEQKIQIKNLLWHLQELEKTSKSKVIESKMLLKIKAETVKYRLDIQKINEAEADFFKSITKTTLSLVRLRREESQWKVWRVYHKWHHRNPF